MGPVAGTVRYTIIDIARFYGIALVFYGHFIEELMLLDNPIAAAQYKFIYSFHMVLFIILAGYVSKDELFRLSPGRFIRSRFSSRLVPFLFFNLLMMLPPMFLDGKLFDLPLPSLDGYLQAMAATIFGLPLLCVPSWFLLLIIGVEIVHYLAFRFLYPSTGRIVAGAVLFYLAGYQLNLHLDLFNPLKGRTIGWNYFFIHEAITMYGFYLFGILLRRRRLFAETPPPWISGALFLAGVVAVAVTYRLNQGPFNFHPYDAVVIIFASHGHLLLFPLTAIAGSLMILALAALVPMPRLIHWLGRNTLVLMCLNGLFYHYVNTPLATWTLESFGGTVLTVTLAGILTTIVSLTLSLPLLYLFTRYTPRLIGRKADRRDLQITDPAVPGP